jgi:DNA-binding transcriptional regulator YhcF (GntR family)
MEKPSLYVQLAEDIKSYIPAHALAPGDRLPSIQELCQMFKVSHATVRAALNLLTQEGVVESRPRWGLFVGQAREGRAAEPRDKVIALLLSGQESAYEAGIIRGVMEQSLKAGYQTIVASNGSDIAVMSYDDISARYFDPLLSSVRQDPHGMGIEATRILLEQIRSGNAGPREIRLQPELVVRNSTDVKLAVNRSDYQVLMDEAQQGSAQPASVSF